MIKVNKTLHFVARMPTWVAIEKLIKNVDVYYNLHLINKISIAYISYIQGISQLHNMNKLFDSLHNLIHKIHRV